MNRIIKTAIFNMIFNIAFSIYHITFGAITKSWWLLTVGVYYCILSVTRFVVISTKKPGRVILKFTGLMLIFLTLPLIGTVILSVVLKQSYVFHEIAMIAIAVYAFIKITLATVKLIKSRRCPSEKILTLRNISFATASVSIFSLQRSMLVSFEGMTETEILIMNILTGSAVCIIVFLLGINLIRRKNSTIG